LKVWLLEENMIPLAVFKEVKVPVDPLMNQDRLSFKEMDFGEVCVSLWLQ
jgi:hypothetical protein